MARKFVFDLQAEDHASAAMNKVAGATDRASMAAQKNAKSSRDLGERTAHLRSTLGGLAGGFLAVKGVELFAGAVSSARGYEDILTQVNQAQKVNAGVSGMSTQALRDQASAIESLNPARLDETDILKGQALLLRAGVVGQQNYGRATQAAADLAVQSNTSVSATSKLLGKALQDPTKAAGALRRSGVVLSQGQQDLIKHFVATGQAGKAQGVVLDAVNAKVGGLAKASGQTASGDLARMQDTLEDTARDMVIRFMPAATQVIGLLARFAPVILPTVIALGTLVAIVKGVALAQAAWNAASSIGAGAAKALAAAQWVLNAAMSANPIALVVIALVALVAAFVIAYKHSATFRAIVQASLRAVGAAATWVAGIARKAGAQFMSTFRQMGAIASWLGNKVAAAGRFLGHGFQAGIHIAVAGATLFIGFARRADQAVGSMVRGAVGKLRSFGSSVRGIFSGAGGWLLHAGQQIIQGLINGISGMIGNLRAKVSAAAGVVRSFWPFSPPKQGPLKTHPMDKAGANVIRMLGDGMASQGGSLKATVASSASTVVGAVGTRSTGGRGGGGVVLHQHFHGPVVGSANEFRAVVVKAFERATPGAPKLPRSALAAAR